MQIVQAVFGVFHHFELAHQLLRRNHLRKIFSTWPKARLNREGLPGELVATYPLLHTIDMLLGRNSWYPRRVSVELQRRLTLGFDQYTLKHIPPCDAFIGISGAGLLTGRLVQQRGGIFICDRGSTHQRVQERIIAEEYRRWQIPTEPATPHILVREEKIYAAADAITVPSQATRRSFIDMGLSPEKVHVIPYGVRLDRFHRPEGVAPPEDSFDVLFAGQVSLRKGIPYLLQAFARLNHPRKRLTVVGAIQEHLRPLLRDLPTENVTFTGSLPQAQLIALMCKSHVMVLPSVEEGLALVQAQAMACGCPVIATQATGAEDLFTDGIEGYIVGDRDVDSLAVRLQSVADDSELRRQFSEAASLRMQTMGGWDDYGRRWDELLHRLTSIPPDPE